MEWPEPVEPGFAQQLLEHIEQSQIAGDELIGGRNLEDMDTLIIDRLSVLVAFPAELGDLTQLQFLTIRDNYSLRSLPESLKQLVNSLETLDIRRTAIPEEEVQYWKAALPSTEILSNYD